jgi:hypothetical protein
MTYVQNNTKTIALDLGRDISAGKATDFGLIDHGSIADRDRNFSPCHHVQPGSETHRTSYPMGIAFSFPGSKTAGT